ncbi:MAG: hypothetical protein ACLUAR_17735 [Pilosibacter sp.]
MLVGGDPGIGNRDAAFTGLQCGRGRKRVPIFPGGIVKADQDSANREQGRFREIFCFYATNLDTIHSAIERAKPDVVIIDSDPDNVPGRYLVGTWKRGAAVRESTNLLMQIARDRITIFIVGHVTKEGVVAGPCWNIWWIRFYFEGDRNTHTGSSGQ